MHNVEDLKVDNYLNLGSKIRAKCAAATLKTSLHPSEPPNRCDRQIEMLREMFAITCVLICYKAGENKHTTPREHLK